MCHIYVHILYVSLAVLDFFAQHMYKVRQEFIIA